MAPEMLLKMVFWF